MTLSNKELSIITVKLCDYCVIIREFGKVERGFEKTQKTYRDRTTRET